jgi:hypothetical protein
MPEPEVLKERKTVSSSYLEINKRN